MIRKTETLFRTEKSPIKLALLLSLPFAAIFSALLAALVFWEYRSRESDETLELTETAKAYFQQVLVTRLWNARHGGVYIEVKGDVKPNPYLNDPERDIVSTSGKKYTKINPAYMTREISEIASDIGRYKFRMSSLRPLNPQNVPDSWEAAALRSFERGGKEASAFSLINGTEHFRYMAPLVVDDECLGCHSTQGYRKGDVRGGLSVSIPADPTRAFHMVRAKRNIRAYSAIGLVSLSFVFGITWVLSTRIVRGVQKELDNERLNAAMLLAGAAAHELRQPMAIISGFSELMREKVRNGEPAEAEMDIILGQLKRMDDLIKRMLNVTEFKVKSYTEDTVIFDLGEGKKDEKKEEG